MKRTSILIDYDELSDRVDLGLENPPPKSTEYRRALIASLPTQFYEELCKNRDCKFLKGEGVLLKTSFGFFNSDNRGKKLLCFHHDNDIPYDFIRSESGVDYYWVCTPINQATTQFLNSVIKAGFHSPYITDEIPIGQNEGGKQGGKQRGKHDKGIFIALICDKEGGRDAKDVHRECMYVLNQYKHPNCSITCVLSNDAIKFLKSLSYNGHTQNKNGTVSQKEIAGELLITNIDEQGIFVIGVDTNKISHGNEEDVEINKSLYNFHSHPRDAYIRHQVHKAWPSNTDYLGVLQLHKSTIFHCVATIEGLYIISLNDSHVKNDGKTRDFVREKYEVAHTQNYTPFEYVAHINSIKMKGIVIFNVIFFPWEQATNTFSIKYFKNGLNCHSNPKTIEVLKKMI